MMQPHLLRRLTVLVGAVACVRGQCTNVWLPGQPYGSVAGMDGEVTAITKAADGALLVSGSFTRVGATVLNRIARFDGASWQALGNGVSGPVHAVLQAANGDVVVGGLFGQAGGVAAANIARWHNGSWSALAGGTNGPVSALAEMPNGDVVAGGQFSNAGGVAVNYVARFDGTGWQAMGAGAPNRVDALAVGSNGELFAGGMFFTGAAADAVVRWNGSAFQPLPGLGWTIGPPSVLALAFDRNGDLLAGGLFSIAGGGNIARWTGATWQGFGVDTFFYVNGLLPMPDGSLGVVGALQSASFQGVSQPMHGVGILTASGWRTFEPGLAQNLGGNGLYGHAMGLLPNGNLLVGGPFPQAGGLPNYGFAVLTTDCAPVVVDAGGGCASSGGANQLVAETAPWLGTTFRTLASGLPTNCLTATVVGFATLTLPLPSVHPLGQPGCILQVRDDILLSFTRGNGSVRSSIAIPPHASLLGGVFHQQIVPVELDAANAIVAITATNRLTMTIGAF